MEKVELEKLSIFELRDLARKVGVFNPTVLKKKDLILAIHDIQSGKTKPYISKTKQGRPPKEIRGYDKLVDIFLPNDILSIQTKEEAKFKIKNDSSELRFCSNPYVNPDTCTEKILFQGYLEILITNCGLLRKRINRLSEPSECVFIPSRYVQQYDMRAGDEVTCYSGMMSPDKPLVFIELKQLNGISPNDLTTIRPSYDELKAENKSEVVTFSDKELQNINDKLQIRYGDQIHCYYDSVDGFRTFIKRFIEKAKEFDNFIYLAPVLKDDSIDTIRTMPAEVHCTDFDNTFEEQKRSAYMALNRAKRLAELGKNVCLIYDDILGLVSLDREDFDQLRISKFFIKSNKRLKKGSLTIICGFPKIGHPYLSSLILTTFPMMENVAIRIDNTGVDLANSFRN